MKPIYIAAAENGRNVALSGHLGGSGRFCSGLPKILSMVNCPTRCPAEAGPWSVSLDSFRWFSARLLAVFDDDMGS
jgi:hypothetical protein